MKQFKTPDMHNIIVFCLEGNFGCAIASVRIVLVKEFLVIKSFAASVFNTKKRKIYAQATIDKGSH